MGNRDKRKEPNEPGSDRELEALLKTRDGYLRAAKGSHGRRNKET